jgi:hypothetical protein
LRAYQAADEEALRARGLLKDWAGEQFLTEAQYTRMEQDTVCQLRRTNIFLRLVLFLFTLLIIGAAAGLFSLIFLQSPGAQTTGVFLLIFAGLCYAGTEYAVSEAHLYRYGIEEALAVCSVGFLCVGLQAALFSAGTHGLNPIALLAGALLSLWIWHRFGLAYAFLAAMIFLVWVPGYWTTSPAAQHALIAALYAAGLIAVATVRSRNRVEFLDQRYSLAEAFLWFGIYLALNLQLSPSHLLGREWPGIQNAADFPKPFYWATWVAAWCLPIAILLRGVRRKDRFLIAAGALTAILTLATNKSYLHWERHSWDPILLGALMIGIALYIHRWLAKGPAGVRAGFTARRLSGKDKQWMTAGSTTFGILAPQPTVETHDAEPRFGGGQSGGGGATSDF